MTTGSYTMGPLYYGSGVTSGAKYFQKFWNGADRGYSLQRYRTVKEYYTDSSGKRRYTIHRVDAYPGPVPDTPHVYSVYVQDYDLSPGTYRYWTSDSSGGHWVYSPWSPRQAGIGFQYQNQVWDANDEAILVNKLRASMTGSDFDPGVFIAEFPKAIKLVTGAATRLVSAYNRARSGRFVSAVKVLLDGQNIKGLELHRARSQQKAFEMHALREARRLGLGPGQPVVDGDVKVTAARLAKLRRKYGDRLGDDSSDNTTPMSLRLSRFWLEKQYGWDPLVKDLQGGVQAAAHALEVPFKRRYSATRAKSQKEWSMSCWCRIAGGGVVLLPRTFTGGVRKRIVAYVTETDVPSMAQMVDLSTVAWEVTPFSFLADWVVPFGNYLSARAFAARSTGTFVHSLKYWVDGKDFISPSENMQHSPVSRFKNIGFVRTVTTSISVPLPVRKPLDKIFTKTHAANAIALLRSLRN